MATVINGRTFDWESITIGMGLISVDFEVQAINYEHEATVTPVYGRGKTARGYGVENLEQSGSMTLNHEAFLQFTIFAATQGGFHNMNPFPITVSYANDDQIPQVDVLRDVKPMKESTEATQGDAEIALRTIDFVILSPILNTGIPVA